MQWRENGRGRTSTKRQTMTPCRSFTTFSEAPDVAPPKELEMAESSPDKFTYENKIAERFGGQKELELIVPTPSDGGSHQERQRSSPKMLGSPKAHASPTIRRFWPSTKNQFSLRAVQ